MGRDAGQAGPRDPRHVRAMSADLEKAQAHGGELVKQRMWSTMPVCPGTSTRSIGTTSHGRLALRAPEALTCGRYQLRRAILFVMHQTMRPTHDPATTPADR